MVTGSPEQNILTAYDAIAPMYSEYSQRYQAYLDAIDRLVTERLSPGMRLLDVGSGDGRRLRKICEIHGLSEVVSVEPSAAMASLCRKATNFPVYELRAEELEKLKVPPFDAITALWNVLGHMANSAVRLEALRCMARKLKPNGLILLDVNNRHNQAAYGYWTVLGRRIKDAVWFDESRGDAHFEWKIGHKTLAAFGHLFTPSELTRLFDRARLEVAERLSINYAHGGISSSPLCGQLFYALRSKD